MHHENLEERCFFFKDRNFYRLNQRSMPRSSEDIIFAVLAVTLRKVTGAKLKTFRCRNI